LLLLPSQLVKTLIPICHDHWFPLYTTLLFKSTTLPIQIYQWTSRPQDEFRNIAAAAILVLLALLLTLNAAAILLRNRYNKK
jgi:ABC-type phosphate transport system permease subunit